MMKKFLLAMVGFVAFSAAGTHMAFAATDDAAIVAESSAILKKDPKNLEARTKRAAAAVNLGDYTSALADLDLLVVQDPTAQTFSNRGNAYMRRGDAEGSSRDYDAAIADFSKSIELGSKNAYVFYFSGTTKVKRGKVDDGLADISKAIKLDSKNVWFYFSRGDAYFDKGNYKAAIADWKKAGKLGFDEATVKERVAKAKAKM